MCFSSLAHEATSKERIATPLTGSEGGPRLFALTKFVETVLANLDRVTTLWPLVTQLLLPVPSLCIQLGP